MLNPDGITNDKVVIVSDPMRMRGVDYRSESGFVLVIARTLPNTRALIQALGRVGRYSEPCQRFVEPGVTPVDMKLEKQMFGDLLHGKRDEPRKASQRRQHK